MQLKPTTLNKEQIAKVVKAALFVGGSAIIAWLISAIAENPDLFGPLTPIVNVVLVALKQVFTQAK